MYSLVSVKFGLTKRSTSWTYSLKHKFHKKLLKAYTLFNDICQFILFLVTLHESNMKSFFYETRNLTYGFFRRRCFFLNNSTFQSYFPPIFKKQRQRKFLAISCQGISQRGELASCIASFVSRKRNYIFFVLKFITCRNVFPPSKSYNMPTIECYSGDGVFLFQEEHVAIDWTVCILRFSLFSNSDLSMSKACVALSLFMSFVATRNC